MIEQTDYTDLFHNLEFDNPLSEIHVVVNNALWHTRDGRIMLISDMSEPHLTNSIKMIFKLCQKLPRLIIELMKRKYYGKPSRPRC